MRKVQLITDGACIGNPGPGGWGVLQNELAATRPGARAPGGRETGSGERLSQVSTPLVPAARSRSRRETPIPSAASSRLDTTP